MKYLNNEMKFWRRIEEQELFQDYQLEESAKNIEKETEEEWRRYEDLRLDEHIRLRELKSWVEDVMSYKYFVEDGNHPGRLWATNTKELAETFCELLNSEGACAFIVNQERILNDKFYYLSYPWSIDKNFEESIPCEDFEEFDPFLYWYN